MNITYTLSKSDALLISDVQNDFLSGGPLPVPDGDEIIPILNEYVRRFRQSGAKIFASRDWHLLNHMSFKTQGGLWPPHCVQDTEGARFHPDLKLPLGTKIISKATNPAKEAYSAFDGTELSNELHSIDIKRFFIGGLATDYCVLNTVLDSVKLGFETFVLIDAVRGINLNPGDVDRAIKAIEKAGVKQVTVESFPEPEETLPLDKTEIDRFEEKPSARVARKKKARMRPKGSAKRIPSER